MPRLRQWIGIELAELSPKERLFSATGGTVTLCPPAPS